MLFNIWGDYFGIAATCLLKYCVLNEMFSFVLIGTYKGNVPHFTLTHSPSEFTTRHPDSHKTSPVCLGRASLVSPRGEQGLCSAVKPQSPEPGLRGLPQSLGPKMVGGSKELRVGSLFFLLVLWFLGCYHNSMNSSLNSAEHMGNLYLAYHLKPFLPHTLLPRQEASIWYQFCR